MAPSCAFKLCALSWRLKGCQLLQGQTVGWNSLLSMTNSSWDCKAEAVYHGSSVVMSEDKLMKPLTRGRLPLLAGKFGSAFRLLALSARSVRWWSTVVGGSFSGMVGNSASSPSSTSPPSATMRHTPSICVAVRQYRLRGMSAIMAIDGHVIRGLRGLCCRYLVLTFCFRSLDFGEAVIRHYRKARRRVSSTARGIPFY